MDETTHEQTPGAMDVRAAGGVEQEGFRAQGQGGGDDSTCEQDQQSPSPGRLHLPPHQQPRGRPTAHFERQAHERFFFSRRPRISVKFFFRISVSSDTVILSLKSVNHQWMVAGSSHQDPSEFGPGDANQTSRWISGVSSRRSRGVDVRFLNCSVEFVKDSTYQQT
jgi:hypothetical protein